MSAVWVVIQSLAGALLGYLAGRYVGRLYADRSWKRLIEDAVRRVSSTHEGAFRKLQAAEEDEEYRS